MKVQPRSRRLATLLAAGLATGAFATPAALGMPAPADTPGTAPSDGGGQVAVDPNPAPLVQSVDEGFDWGSAAIGAAGAGGLALLLLGASTTQRTRHHRVGVIR
jgi:hypothetical protein